MWFGDERGYNATHAPAFVDLLELWFGDERGYNATVAGAEPSARGCGLVMKEDITQPEVLLSALNDSCGLVMKEDITQPNVRT